MTSKTCVNIRRRRNYKEETPGAMETVGVSQHQYICDDDKKMHLINEEALRLEKAGVDVTLSESGEIFAVFNYSI